MTRLLSDVHLARQASDGDRRAFAAIYERYHQDVYRFCLAIVRRPEDAEDALQSTMAKALAALPGEQREVKLKPWLYRVAHNESIDLLRRRREGPELNDEHLGDGTGLAEAVAQRERLSRLLADLGELPERQRSALVMRELGGLAYEQIGEAFESTPAVARQTVYEARVGLRELEAGREMSCERVRHRLSEADGRVRRRRDVRAHLRACPDCRAFRDSIESRRGDFAALAPLPGAAAASILHVLLGGKVAAGGGLAGGASAAGAGAGKVAGTSLAVKAVATVAVVATAGVTAADRGGLIDAGLPGAGRGDSAKSAPAPDGGANPAAPASKSTGARNAPGATAARARGGLDAAAPAGDGRAGNGASDPVGTAPVKAPAQPVAETNGGNSDPPGTPSAASRHGRETAAEHSSTNGGKALGRGKRKAHSTSPSHSDEGAKGPQGNADEGGQGKGKGEGQRSIAGTPAKTRPTPAETPPKGKTSGGPEGPSAEHGKGKASESEIAP